MTCQDGRSGKFVLSEFKTQRCMEHRTNTLCIYYHSTKERRRSTDKFTYTAQPCVQLYDSTTKVWKSPEHCDKGDMCEQAHTILEVLFHPKTYKTLSCKSKSCDRGDLCAFIHKDEERAPRRVMTERQTPQQDSISAEQQTIQRHRALSVPSRYRESPLLRIMSMNVLPSGEDTLPPAESSSSGQYDEHEAVLAILESFIPERKKSHLPGLRDFCASLEAGCFMTAKLAASKETMKPCSMPGVFPKESTSAPYSRANKAG